MRAKPRILSARFAHIIGAVTMSGCAVSSDLPTNVPADPPPGAALAAELVWSHLEQPADAMPTIYWVEGPCIVPQSTSDRCIAGGIYFADSSDVFVIRNSDIITKTALAHELVHASGIPDESEARRLTGPENAYLEENGYGR